jgi:IS605 OrfB family transposase
VGNVLTKLIQIIPDDDINGTYKIIRDWMYHSTSLANLIMTETYVITQRARALCTAQPELDYFQAVAKMKVERVGSYIGKVTEKTIGSSFGYCLSKSPNYAENIPGAIRTKIDKVVGQHFQADVKTNGLLKGNCSLRSYSRKNMAVYLPSSKGASKFTCEDGNYYFSTINKLRFKVFLGRDNSKNKLAIDRIISGEYKMPDVSIKIKDNKIFVLAPITIEVTDLGLDPELSVGVDLGITIPAVCALSTGLDRAFIGNGTEIVNYRFSMRRKRKNLQKSLTLSTGGRGRGKKLKALERISSTESNWIKTKNHLISKKIIDFALTNGAGTVKLELLEGFTKEHSSNIVLKDWTYYQLGEMIQYKAKIAGIVVVRIDPYHTSQTCNVCGHSTKENRPKGTKGQAYFKCVSCGHKTNADLNAARNIAKSTKIVTKKKECQYHKLKSNLIEVS